MVHDGMDTSRWIPGVWARSCVTACADDDRPLRAPAVALLYCLASYMSASDDKVRGHTRDDLKAGSGLRDDMAFAGARRELEERGIIRSWKRPGRTVEYVPVRDYVESQHEVAPIVGSDPTLGQTQRGVEPNDQHGVAPNADGWVGPNNQHGVGPNTLLPSVAPTLPKSLPVVATNVIDAAFDAWWTIYPRRVGKPKARTAFKAAAKKAKGTDALFDGLAPWVAYWDDRGEPEFVPHPTTWLNGERWNDQPPASSTGKVKIGKGATQSVLERLASLDTAPDVFPTSSDNDTQELNP